MEMKTILQKSSVVDVRLGGSLRASQGAAFHSDGSVSIYYRCGKTESV